MREQKPLNPSAMQRAPQSSLEYHRLPQPGKWRLRPPSNCRTNTIWRWPIRPGGSALRGIVKDPNAAYQYTSKGNLVAVVTNGTAVLGLGDIGPLASKPVMEGKGVLFKKFAGIDVFDIEINEKDPDKLVEIIAALEPTFAASIWKILKPRLFLCRAQVACPNEIPVFHDDQHGTAIVVGAALLNGLTVVGKDIDQVKLVVSGAGAAALACVGLLVKLGLPKKNIWLTDLAGVVYQGRTELMTTTKFSMCKKHRPAHWLK